MLFYQVNKKRKEYLIKQVNQIVQTMLYTLENIPVISFY